MFYAVALDTYALVQATLIDANTREAYDLSVPGTVVTYKFYGAGTGGEVLATLTGDGTDGQVDVAFGAGDLATPGRYVGEFIITQGSNEFTVFEAFPLTIREPIETADFTTPPPGETTYGPFTVSGVLTIDGALVVNGAMVVTGAIAWSGPLTLNYAPTSDMHAATKKYVDDAIAAL
jgi:hypothetical protein